MIILITGASHTGKTLLAQRLMERYRIPYYSADHIKMGLIRSGYAALTPEQDEEITVYLWPVLREMIKTAVENRQSFILEGCYVPFDWRKDFEEKYLSQVLFLCLAFSDEYIDAYRREIAAHARDIEDRLESESPAAEQLKADNRAYIAGFRDSGERVTVIEEDYERAVETLLRELDEKIRETGREERL